MIWRGCVSRRTTVPATHEKVEATALATGGGSRKAASSRQGNYFEMTSPVA